MLSVEDRLVIQELYARYCWAMDTGDPDALVATYTPTGVFSPPTNLVVIGHDALRKWAIGRAAFRLTEATTNGQHWNANLVLEGDGQSARGRCYFMRIMHTREPMSVVFDASGWYEDELRKVDGAWKFQSRNGTRNMPVKPAA